MMPALPRSIQGVFWSAYSTATVSCVNYDANFAFLGFYIVRENLRGCGYGLRIWNKAINAIGRPKRLSLLTIFWHCSFRPFSSRTAPRAASWQRTVNGFRRGFAALKGLAMLIRSETCGVQGGTASAGRAFAIPAASLPTLLLGGLLLLIGP
jgi:hypothetical protein